MVNRKARLQGQKIWLTFGPKTHAEAAKQMVLWEMIHGHIPPGNVWVVETCEASTPDVVFRHEVTRTTVYTVKPLREDEANA